MKPRESIDIENREQWPTAFTWLSEQAGLFLDAFSGPIRRLRLTMKPRKEQKSHDSPTGLRTAPQFSWYIVKGDQQRLTADSDEFCFTCQLLCGADDVLSAKA